MAQQKVAGELVRPKYMTVGSYRPKGVLKVAFPPIFFFDMYIIVSPSEVELWEEGLSLKVFNDVSDKGKGVVVAYGPFVQDTIVHNGLEFPVLLLPIEQCRCVWWFRICYVFFPFALSHADTSDCLLSSLPPSLHKGSCTFTIWSCWYDLISSPHALYDIYLTLRYDLVFLLVQYTSTSHSYDY